MIEPDVQKVLPLSPTSTLRMLELLFAILMVPTPKDNLSVSHCCHCRDGTIHLIVSKTQGVFLIELRPPTAGVADVARVQWKM